MPTALRQQKYPFGSQRTDPHWSTKGLVFYSQFKPAGKLIDESPYGNHGTITGATWTGDGLDFDGTGDFILFANSMSLTEFTFVIRFNADDLTARSLIGDHTDNDNYAFLLNATTVRLRTTTTYNFTVPTMLTGTWYTICYTRDSTNRIRCYLDAVESSTGLIVNAVPFSLTAIGDATAGAEDFDGRMSDVKIYNRALSASEIQALYINPDLPMKQDTSWMGFVPTGIVIPRMIHHYKQAGGL